jgi:hypothetical protein
MNNEMDSTGSASASDAASGATGAAASHSVLERLLGMARRYREEGKYLEASELFWALLEEHSDTPQADMAKVELLALAEGYERAGNQHMARSMYERLLDLES